MYTASSQALHKQVAGWIWPMGHDWLIPSVEKCYEQQPREVANLSNRERQKPQEQIPSPQLELRPGFPIKQSNQKPMSPLTWSTQVASQVRELVEKGRKRIWRSTQEISGRTLQCCQCFILFHSSSSQHKLIEENSENKRLLCLSLWGQQRRETGIKLYFTLNSGRRSPRNKQDSISFKEK